MAVVGSPPNTMLSDKMKEVIFYNCVISIVKRRSVNPGRNNGVIDPD